MFMAEVVKFTDLIFVPWTNNLNKLLCNLLVQKCKGAGSVAPLISGPGNIIKKQWRTTR